MKELKFKDHAMLDIETLGKTQNPVIPQISAVQFCPITGETFSEFEVRISIQSCLDAGLTVDESTLKFWFQQEKEAQELVLDPHGIKEQKTLAEALQMFSTWIHEISPEWTKIWGNGPAFDLAKVGAAYDAVGLKKPWNHWNERCVRTANMLAPQFKKEMPFTGIKHHGIDDSKHQIKYLMCALNHALDGK